MLHCWHSFEGLRFSHIAGRQAGTRVDESIVINFFMVIIEAPPPPFVENDLARAASAYLRRA